VRRRIVLAMTFIAVVGVVVLGIPLAIVAARIAHTEAQRRVDQEATAVAFAVDDVLENDRNVSSARLDRLARDGYVVLTLAGGRRVTARRSAPRPRPGGGRRSGSRSRQMTWTSGPWVRSSSSPGSGPSASFRRSSWPS
jgi:hypothetical protein